MIDWPYELDNGFNDKDVIYLLNQTSFNIKYSF